MSKTPTSRGTTASAPSRASGRIVVTQQGSAPAKTLWYLRVEDTTAKPLLESAFPNRRIALDRDFPAGVYRVIVWYRPCEGLCPTTGESGLGALQQVCGAQVQLTAGQRARATAVIDSDATCTVKVSA